MCKCFDFPPDIVLILREFPAEVRRDFLNPCTIIDHFHPPEYNHASNMQCPRTFRTPSFIEGTERNTVIGPDGIHPMAVLPSAVKIQAPVLGVVIVIHRHAIRVALRSMHGQDTAFFRLQNSNTFLLRYLLLFAFKFSEHDSSFHEGMQPEYSNCIPDGA